MHERASPAARREKYKEQGVKRSKSRKVTGCVIALVLLALGAAAQQEVDPEHFDPSPGATQKLTSGAHPKRVTSRQKRRARKPASMMAKSNRQKTAAQPQTLNRL